MSNDNSIMCVYIYINSEFGTVKSGRVNVLITPSNFNEVMFSSCLK